MFDSSLCRFEFRILVRQYCCFTGNRLRIVYTVCKNSKESRHNVGYHKTYYRDALIRCPLGRMIRFEYEIMIPITLPYLSYRNKIFPKLNQIFKLDTVLFDF